MASEGQQPIHEAKEVDGMEVTEDMATKTLGFKGHQHIRISWIDVLLWRVLWSRR